MPTISVFFPTHRRPDQLARVLEAYAEARGRGPEFELVVVDDGSGDATASILRGFAERHPAWFKPLILEQNVGPARARNAGLPLTTGEVILITGDDILPPPDLVARHLAWHQAHPDAESALLGRVVWPDALPPTPFMRWLEEAGSMFYFDYPALSPDRPAGGSHFYTCQVSLKRALLFRTTLFDPDFRYASHEDLELGYRLEQAGMKLWYQPDFVAGHWHRLAFTDVVRRIYTMGYSAPTYWTKVPDTAGPARRVVKSTLRLLAATPLARQVLLRLVSAASARSSHAYWRSLLTLAYWVGLADAWRGKPRMAIPSIPEALPC